MEQLLTKSVSKSVLKGEKNLQIQKQPEKKKRISPFPQLLPPSLVALGYARSLSLISPSLDLVASSFLMKTLDAEQKAQYLRRGGRDELGRGLGSQLTAADFLTFKEGNLVLLNSFCCVGFGLHLWPLAFSCSQ